MIILTLLDTPKTWIDHNMEYGVLWQSYRTYWLGQIVNWMQSDMKVRLGSLKRHCKSQNECEELGSCLFLENSLQKTIFQTFLCLLAIRKGGQWKTLFSQRKILSGQRKTLSSQRKIWLGFQESVFPFGCVCFSKSGFQETTFQTFMCLFAIRKVG